MNKNFILTIYKQPQTIFTLKDISLLFPKILYDNLKVRVAYAIKSGSLKKLRRGVYAKDNYNVLELSNKIISPSYVSLETVLAKEGIVFQYYESIFAIGYISRTVQVGDHSLVYRKIKNEILLNKAGIKDEGTVFIAGKERAFLDAVFLYRDYHFDNLRPLNWDKIMELKSIYMSKAMNKRVEDYYKIYKEDHV